jgi:hypothetical protein
MFEPRTARENIGRLDLKYIGGVERFDLWHMTSNTKPFDDYRLRIHVVGGNVGEWDIFTLPVRDNREINQSQAPDQRRICGNWGDVLLTFEEADLIDTYLRCFVPWMLGRNLTNDGA